MNTIVRLRVRQARVDEFIKNNELIAPAQVYILRSDATGEFGRLKSTNDHFFKLQEFYIQLHMGGVYVQQVVKDLEVGISSESIEVPLKLATVNDLAFAKAEFKKGLVYFISKSDTSIKNRIKCISGSTAFGTLTELWKSKRIYVQESSFINPISIHRAAMTA